MVSPSRLKASSATKKTASPPSTDKSSEQPAASTTPVSSYCLGTAAMMLPNLNATVEASGDDATPSTAPARVLPEHALSSEDNNHDDSDSACSNFSTTHALVDGSNNSDSTPASVQAINSNAVPLRPKAKAPKKTLGKRLRADSNVSSASSSGTAAVPAKKRVRSNALMRSAPRATVVVTPGSLAGNSEFMCVYASSFLAHQQRLIANIGTGTSPPPSSSSSSAQMAHNFTLTSQSSSARPSWPKRLTKPKPTSAPRSKTPSH